MKTVRNALLVSLASTGMLFVYYMASGQAVELDELWLNAVAMFFGVFGYLLFAGRKKKHNHRK